MRSDAEFQFDGDIYLFKDHDNLDMINLIQKGGPLTVRQIITNIKFFGSDGRKLSHPNFVFGETFSLKICKESSQFLGITIRSCNVHYSSFVIAFSICNKHLNP